ncbi:hypothetical protein [Tolumonas lignilytica]|uniref:hypothetical protein n=1 Tax=Tolumonas lignilytica TaxID=1283284 RepID=UPI000466091D|nr:hypothetical protein [Tolumonas lignilytica]
MFIQVNKQLLRNQQYDDALRQACDKLSSQGIKNFIHYVEPCRVVELFDPPQRLKAQIDPMRGGIWLIRS